MLADGAAGEVLLSGEAGGHSGGAQVGLVGGVVVADLFEEMRADGFQAMAVGEPVVCVDGAERGESGPSGHGPSRWRRRG